MFNTIPLLRKIALLAKEYRNQDPELNQALIDLDKEDAETKTRYEQALKRVGINCVVCNRLFLPLPHNYSDCCSIGCRYK